MSDHQFGPPAQPGFGPPQQGTPIPPQQGGYGYPQQPPAPQQQPQWGGGAVPPQAFPPGQPGGYPMGYSAPKKSRKGLWITLGVVSAVILGGAGAIAYLVNDTVSKTGTHKVVLPQTFHDLTSDPEDETAKQLADSLQSSMSADKSSFTQPEPVSAIYRSEDQTKMLLVSGETGNVLFPSKQVDAVYDGFGRSGKTSVSDRTDVDPGPLGGRLSCGTTVISGQDGAVCVWADSSSAVMVLEMDFDGKTATKEQVIADTKELRQTSEVPK